VSPVAADDELEEATGPVLTPADDDVAVWANATCGTNADSAAPIAKTTPTIASVLVILFMLHHI
jgi:hypothetical protein